uniref:Prolactin 2 n=1 Tax=Acanthochromis polyacanthus TaxID=80966 RepID=A0A3Q1G981_9TELE
MIHEGKSSKVWFVVLTLVYLNFSMWPVALSRHVATARLAVRFLSLADLFDRVIQQSSRMHGISSDLHSQFNLMGKRKCHTYGILTPDDKENAQRLGVSVNITYGVILMLLGAWNDPLSQLYWSMSQDQNQDFNHYTSNKALEITDMVHELKDGVTKMAEKVEIHLCIWVNGLLWSFDQTIMTEKKHFSFDPLILPPVPFDCPVKDGHSVAFHLAPPCCLHVRLVELLSQRWTV